MGETDDWIPDELSFIALGKNAEEWQYYDSPEMPLNAAAKKQLETEYRKDATRLLAVLYENGIHLEKTIAHLKTILRGLDPDTKLYEKLMGNPVLRAIASEKYR
jgi:hypothetical protein